MSKNCGLYSSVHVYVNLLDITTQLTQDYTFCSLQSTLESAQMSLQATKKQLQEKELECTTSQEHCTQVILIFLLPY